MLAVEQLRLVVPMLAAMVPAAVFAYKFWRGRAKVKELREAFEAAVNANRELVPMVDDERLKLALEVKIVTLQVVIELIDGDIITDNFGWELDEKVKALSKVVKTEKQGSYEAGCSLKSACWLSGQILVRSWSSQTTGK